MKEHLKEVIREFQEQHVVERMFYAKNCWECFVSIQSDFQTELGEFKQMLQRTGPIDYGEIAVEDAIEIFLFCVMLGIDDSDLFLNKEELLLALRSYKGPFEETAIAMEEFLLYGGRISTESIDAQRKNQLLTYVIFRPW